MSRKYFGTDGVRGRVGQMPITPEFVLRLGAAAGRVLKRKNPQGRVSVLIGKDTRVSGYVLETALQAGFLAAGVDVELCGPLPTPAIAHLTVAQRMAAGVVISASHNPYWDNGIKFFSETGTKLPDDVELEIEEEIDRENTCVDSASLGRAHRIDSAAGRYVEFCKRTVPEKFNLRGMRILLDCANGAAYQVAPTVFRELGADVVATFCSPDGVNINEGCGATHTDTLPERVAAAKADFGIALDGDADRLIMADRNRVFNGDELLYIMVCDRMAQEPVQGVVGTLMTNYALEKRLGQIGIPFVRAKVGDRYVVEQLRARGWNFGGESSGHLLALDRQTTGDGIVSALQVLHAMVRTGKTLADLSADLQMLPQTLVNCRIEKGFDWKSSAATVKAVEDVERQLGSDGRVLIRPSGTEPLLRIMVEAADPVRAKALAEAIAATLPA